MMYLSWNAVIIKDCYLYKPSEVKKGIKELRKENPDNEGLAKRSNRSYLREWAAHALAYNWNFMKGRAKDATLQYNLARKHAVMYGIIGPLALLILNLFY